MFRYGCKRWRLIVSRREQVEIFQLSGQGELCVKGDNVRAAISF
jgi:hypothetical protein